MPTWALLAALCVQFVPTYAAETTGAISGTVAVGTVGVPNSTVTIDGPAEHTTVHTDAAGRYSIVSLPPDIYTISAQANGYETVTQTNVTVQADSTLYENLQTKKSLVEIGHAVAHAAHSLVRPGVMADIYSLNAQDIKAASALGGGTQRDSLYSAVALAPGAFVPIGGSGFGQSIMIRGGDYTQTGNEFDGIPLNRDFDHYAQSPLSSLGASEVQIYTGAAPIDQQASGLAGYVNTVVKTGTYPGFGELDLGIGGPAFYNHAQIEAGGANGPDRKFTYYLGLSGYDQAPRLLDQYNGRSYAQNYAQIYNVAATGCGSSHPSAGCYLNGSASNSQGDGYIGNLPIGPNGYATLPTFWGDQAKGSDREAVANFHFAVPHHADHGRDDVQFLYANSLYQTGANASLNDFGSALGDILNGTITQANGTVLTSCGFVTSGDCAIAPPLAYGLPGAYPYYIDQNAYTGPLNTALTAGNLGNIRTIGFNGRPAGAVDATIPNTLSDGASNQFSLEKLQFQKNFGSSAYARLYLYSEFSSQSNNGLDSVYQPYFSDPFLADYGVTVHQRGFAGTVADALSTQHFMNFDFGQSYSNSNRSNNLAAAGGGQSPVAVLVDSTHPTAGCYGLGSGAPAIASCTTEAATYVLPQVGAAVPGYALAPSPGSPDIPTAATLTCGAGPCEYLAVSNGANAQINSVRTRFSNVALQDRMRASERLAFEFGLRLDDFAYLTSNTDTPENELYVNTFNALHCINGTTLAQKTNATDSCSLLGPGFVPTALTASSPNLDYQAISPRFGATYTLNPLNVFRFSAGRSLEPAPAAAVQSAYAQPFSPDSQFYSNFGFASSVRNIPPETSTNVDFSWEHAFRDNSSSLKVTPFDRVSKNEFTVLQVDPKTQFDAFVNGLDRETKGIELAVKHGDFAKNGFSGILSYTYSHAAAHFRTFSTGGSVVAAANTGIQTYNGYTSFCAQNPKDARCPASVIASPCYTTAGAPAGGSGFTAGVPMSGCGAGSVANPYWNASPQSLIDPNAAFVPFNGTIANGASGNAASPFLPHVASLIMNYRHNRFAVTPSMQFEAGARYGSPLAAQGVAPDSCGATLSGVTAGDPRYAAGAPAGSPYDASSCYSVIPIPDPYTGKFDNLGEFRQPSLLAGNLKFSYDASHAATFEVTMQNLFFRCFGGSKVPWAAGNLACNYDQGSPYVGNVYNPGDAIQQTAASPYVPTITGTEQNGTATSALPFELYADVRFKF